MFPRLMLLLLAACGAPDIDPALLSEPRPYLRLSVSTEVAAGTPTALEQTARAFELSSTFAFDHACAFEGGAFSFESRADAAPAVELVASRWPATGSRWGLECTEAECPTQLLRLRWDADGGRFDARPAKASDGLPAGTTCRASFVADALSPEQAVLEGTCENLLGAFTKGSDPIRFGPVQVSFRALCSRP